MEGSALSSNPFFTVALPMIFTFVVATWVSIHQQGRHLDQVDKRLGQMDKGIEDVNHGLEGRLGDFRDEMKLALEAINQNLVLINAKLDGHGERIAKLEGPSLVRASQ